MVLGGWDGVVGPRPAAGKGLQRRVCVGATAQLAAGREKRGELCPHFSSCTFPLAPGEDGGACSRNWGCRRHPGEQRPRPSPPEPGEPGAAGGKAARKGRVEHLRLAA